MGRVQKTHFIFVTGGVLSGLGKGITAASIGAVLRARGLTVSMQKCDPYLNVDAGTINPAEHGECFVTKDGAETDLDLGHYERFLDVELTQASSTMSGRLLLKTIQDERAGKFLGEDVQMVPHFTNVIEQDIIASGKGSDVHIVEIGGTVGDIESTAFLEAIRIMALRYPERCMFAYVVYAPYLGTSQEFKTKPAQNAVRDLRGLGITPDVLLVRTEQPPKKSLAPKLSMFTGVPAAAVITLPNSKTVYEVPLILEAHGVSDLITHHFGLKAKRPDMKKWHNIVRAATTDWPQTVTIAIVAKYLENEDAYLSVTRALQSAARANKINLNIHWVNAEELEGESGDSLGQYHGVLVPGGFGARAVEGKVSAATYAMQNNLPYLGICLGMQVAVIAAARLAGLKAAISSEVNGKAAHPVIYIMRDQKGKEATGGTMRLGNYDCVLQPGSLAHKVYGASKIVERHRHRYEVNQKYNRYYQKSGLRLSGLSPDGRLVEVVEHTNHPYFIGTQAHPEFRSRPDRPHPLFDGLIKAALRRAGGKPV